MNTKSLLLGSDLDLSFRSPSSSPNRNPLTGSKSTLEFTSGQTVRSAPSRKAAMAPGRPPVSRKGAWPWPSAVIVSTQG